MAYVSLMDVALADRQAATIEAMKNGAPLIYGGRIATDDLLGEPDLLIKRNDGYLAADIKSGRGESGEPCLWALTAADALGSAVDVIVSDRTSGNELVVGLTAFPSATRLEDIKRHAREQGRRARLVVR